MPTYVFRTNSNTPAGSMIDTPLLDRVRAALEDTLDAGIAVMYDPADLVEERDDQGAKVVAHLEWPEQRRFGEAREHIDRHFVTFDSAGEL